MENKFSNLILSIHIHFGDFSIFVYDRWNIMCMYIRVKVSPGNMDDLSKRRNYSINIWEISGVRGQNSLSTILHVFSYYSNIKVLIIVSVSEGNTLIVDDGKRNSFTCSPYLSFTQLDLFDPSFPPPCSSKRYLESEFCGIREKAGTRQTPRKLQVYLSSNREDN